MALGHMLTSKTWQTLNSERKEVESGEVIEGGGSNGAVSFLAKRLTMASCAPPAQARSDMLNDCGSILYVRPDFSSAVKFTDSKVAGLGRSWSDMTFPN